MVRKEDKAARTSSVRQPPDEAAAFFGAVLAERRTPAVTAASDPPTQPRDDRWLDESFEGQLAVDVYQTDEAVVVQSAVAGVRVEDLDITVNNDMVTIRGIRRRGQAVPAQDYFYQECYWGGFSRSIILPVDVKGDKVTATLKNGILTVVLPKVDRPRAKSVRVHEELDETER
jgi:HSP20 family protein